MTAPKLATPMRTTSGVFALGTTVHEEHAHVAPEAEEHDLCDGDYDPDCDVVAPLSMRTSCMQLLWVCGDCGEHYPRSIACPARCGACDAPREHFYSPLED
ncbi:MAG: hypothetical protein NVS3B10_09800 [Polyangiales bacterium]